MKITILLMFTIGLIGNKCFGQKINIRKTANSCQKQTSTNNTWATYYGGNAGEICNGSVRDKQNNIYIFGKTGSSNNITTTGSHQVMYGGGGDGFLAKFDKYGNIIWATYYGGVGDDEIVGASVDNYENIIICGLTSSLTNISTPGSFQENGPGGSFVAKFNSNGLRMWGTYFNYGAIRNICTDKSGNIIFCGYTNLTTGLSTSGAYHINCAGDYDGFLVKFSPNGNRLWSTYYGGSNYDDCFSCTSDSSSNILITGYTYSANGISTSGAFQINMNGIEDAFVAKFNSSGNILWSTYCGGNDFETGFSICTDKSNNIIIAGSGNSLIDLATVGTHKMIPDGDDAFIVKFDSSGIKKWGTYYGGQDGMEPDRCNIVTTNSNDEILIAGSTTADTGIATIGSYRNSISGMIDGYFAKFSPFGILEWGSYFGGSLNDNLSGISVDNLNNIIIAGTTASDSNIATNGAFQTIIGGIQDGLLASFDSTGHITAVPTLSNPTKNSLLQVYPNPTKDKITVSIKEYAGKGGSLVLTDIEGKVVKSVVVKSQECTIEVKELPAGVYLLQFEDGEVCETVKVVKE